MPTRRDGVMPDGHPRYLRAYDRVEFSVPDGAIAALRDGNERYGASALLAEGRDGPFAPFIAFSCHARAGRRWLVLRNWMEQYAIEVELTEERLGEIRPLPPEEAWRIARALDGDDVEVEGPEP
jgi:hypothetical protein